MKFSTILTIVAFSVTAFAAPTGDLAALAERGEELCCTGLGSFYPSTVDEAVEERTVEEVVEVEIEERGEEMCCAGLGTFYDPAVDDA